jgi:hypothetical protein
VASFWLLPVQFNVLLPPATLNATQVTALTKQISMNSGAEVVFKSMCFEMHGLEHEVRAAVNMILELDIIKVRGNMLNIHGLLNRCAGFPSRDSLSNRAV